MLAAAAATAGASQPVIAALLGLGAAGLAGAVVAMAWSVHARQIRLAEMLVRRQFILTREPAAPEQPLNGHAGPEAALAGVQETLETVGAREAQAGQKAHGAPGGHAGTATAETEAGEPRPPGPRSWSSTARRRSSSASRSATVSARPPSERR